MEPFPWRCFMEENVLLITNKSQEKSTKPKFTPDIPAAAQNLQNATNTSPINLDNNIKTADSTKKKKTTQTKTFAQAVSNICNIPTSQLPKPVLKGDNFAIAISEEEYDAGMETCKHNLHARIIWPKGSTPLTVYALRNILAIKSIAFQP